MLPTYGTSWIIVYMYCTHTAMQKSSAVVNHHRGASGIQESNGCLRDGVGVSFEAEAGESIVVDSWGGHVDI
ncbi:hypothetical protein PROFUN_08188 [Planoprotostelium fungivorum]|uniref:Uncharacterized protein n=1 Tax=Planoprotostelium fungivorum TaxID=1890364 RepID=A0A2P6N666_9EUKA|nr:hypothetical protein PROFUN_08188 [Planoprotostelium fungivorum]